MRKKFFLYFWLLLSSIYGSVDPDVAVRIDESTHYIHGCINMLNGSFFLQSQDLFVSSDESMNFTRYYSSKQGLDYDGGWSYCPHLEITNYRWEEAVCPEPDGVFVHYEKVHEDLNGKHPLIVLKPSKSATISFFKNTRSHLLSGQTNIKNNRLIFSIKKGRVKRADLITGNGTKRIYLLKTVKFGKDRVKRRLLLHEEIHPNQRVSIYEYDDHFRLIKMSKLNPDRGMIYSGISFSHEGDKKRKNHNFSLTCQGENIKYSNSRLKNFV